MKKVFLVMLLCLLLLSGCKNKEEDEKNEYLAMKSNLLGNKKYTSSEDLICNITVSVDRLDEEKVSYKVVFSNAKENMNNIKALVVHNYYTEEVFPTIGLFDETKKMSINSDDKLKLEGTIETTNDIDNLDLELKILIEYLDDDGKVKDIYYKTTK